MTLYRFYKLDLHGHINGLPEPVECSDDDDAIEKAKERAESCVIEIWDLQRRVAVIEAQEGARNGPLRSPGTYGDAQGPSQSGQASEPPARDQSTPQTTTPGR